MNRKVLLALSAALLLFATSLPQSNAQTSEPGPSKAPFTPSGTVQGVSLEQAAADLGPVTGIANAGDARLFLTLRGGRILIYENGAVRPQDFLSIANLINLNGFERGLLSVAFHPDYDANGFFFVNYTNVNGDTVVARYQVSANDPNQADAASAKILLTIPQPEANHNGGQLQFGPDGYLYIGMGDGGGAFDPGCRAQKTDTLLGKMLRIDVDQNVNTPPYHGIPSDNPYRGAGDPPDEIWSGGFRNPWRFSFDRQTGDLWIADVGQNQREEVNFQPASSNGGENYGWKVKEGTLCTNDSNACPGTTPACNSSAYTDPVLEYAHTLGCSVTGGYVYRGSRLPQLRGSYIFGDFCSGDVWAASRQGNDFNVRTIAGNAGQLSTFGEDSQGELYAATLGGRLFRITGPAAGAKAETVGLYNPQSTLFQLKSANTAAGPVRTFRFGPQRHDWLPIAGDWNGDGKTTVGFYEQKTGLFRLKNTATGRAADVVLRVDAPSDEALPIAGDWDGDGDDTVGLYDPATGEFLLKNTLSGSAFDVTRRFEDAAGVLLPVAGDWNGDGNDTVGLFDPQASIFYLANNLQALKPDLQIQFGPRGRNSLPVTGDWDGNGTDGLGVYDPASATFRLRNALSAGNPDLTFRFGQRRGGWLPVAGAW